MMRTYYYLLPLLFISIGAVTIGMFYPHGSLAIKSSKWPSVEGIIQKSKVIHLGRNTASKKFFEYSFTINDESYLGNTAFYGQNFSTSSKSLEFSHKYKVSSKVNVYYNPAHPAQSVIEPGLKMAALFVPGIGLVFFGGGLFFFFLIRLEKKRCTTVDTSVNRRVHKPVKPQRDTSLSVPEKTKISLVETPRGFIMAVPFNKWKKTPLMFFFFGISIWCLIAGGFFIPFLLPALVFAHIILCMLFGRWKIICNNNTLTLKTGFLYLSWQASMPI
ncbi:MAG: DUF3592 domain-containing protein, partial [Lentisphaeraceae bacterium]|nr:DUF3592 domain-containing protein [Lentisphaeraceae bacterium]